jgi:hypothetical protein
MQYKTKILDPNFRKSFLKELEDRNNQYEKLYGKSNCMEIILELCEIHDVEPESIKTLINGKIKMKIKDEAISINLIKDVKRAKLI